MSEKQEFRKLTREELNELAGEELPERAAMSLVNANVAAPINAALALNVLSDGSAALAAAQQTAPVNQGICPPSSPRPGARRRLPTGRPPFLDRPFSTDLIPFHGHRSRRDDGRE